MTTIADIRARVLAGRDLANNRFEAACAAAEAARLTFGRASAEYDVAATAASVMAARRAIVQSHVSMALDALAWASESADHAFAVWHEGMAARHATEAQRVAAEGEETRELAA